MKKPKKKNKDKKLFDTSKADIIINKESNEFDNINKFMRKVEHEYQLENNTDEFVSGKMYDKKRIEKMLQRSKYR